MIETSGDDQHQHLEVVRGVGEERQHDLQEAVARDLRDDAGEHGDGRDRHRLVRVGQPAVERRDRHLHQERERERQEHPVLVGARERQVLERAEREVERRAVVAGGDHAGRHRGGEHQERPDHRVDDHLDRGAHAVSGAPRPDQEVERDQHQVEERHEQHQVLREEGTQHRALSQPEPEVVGVGPLDLAHRRPRQRDREQHGREQHQRDVEPVDPELVVDPEGADPDLVGDELQPRVAGVEAGDEADRDPDRDQAGDGRRPSDVARGKRVDDAAPGPEAAR